MTTTTTLAPAANGAAEIMERVLLVGDLSKLTPDERVQYYARTCESLGLNPLTKPFDYLSLSGKLVLYATRTATDQLRERRGISLTIVGREQTDEIYVVTARATTPDGRTDESTGVVSLGRLNGDALANALMKCETKAKRRVTLSICGLGWMDESETETVRDARPARVDHATGEVIDAEPSTPRNPRAAQYDALMVDEDAPKPGPVCGLQGCATPLAAMVDGRGKTHTAEKLAAWRRREYGLVLCDEHARERKAATAEPEPADDTAVPGEF